MMGLEISREERVDNLINPRTECSFDRSTVELSLQFSEELLSSVGVSREQFIKLVLAAYLSMVTIVAPKYSLQVYVGGDEIHSYMHEVRIKIGNVTDGYAMTNLIEGNFKRTLTDLLFKR